MMETPQSDAVVDDELRLRRIAGKLAAIRAGGALPDVFGVQCHRFELGGRVSNSMHSADNAPHVVQPNSATEA